MVLESSFLYDSCDVVVSITVLYLVDCGFESWPEDCAFTHFIQLNSEQFLKVIHDSLHILPIS
jgi:hypothetical protein